MANLEKEPDNPYDFEERTYLFAQRVRTFVKQLPRTAGNIQDVPQLIRASGSVAANYVEANEALSPKDFRKCAKIARREAKESRLFLRLVDVRNNNGLETERSALLREADELKLILSSMIRNSERDKPG
jgi:four helix bundle protein